MVTNAMRLRSPIGRSVLVAAVLGVFVFGLAACGGSSHKSASSKGGSAKGSITFLAADYSALTKPYWVDLIKKFEQANPGSKVNLQVVSWDDINQKVTTLVSTNQQPDILNLDAYANFAADKLLLPVSQVTSPALQQDFLPKFADNGKVNGTAYGVPLLASVRALFYNKDLFKQAGITSPPRTWDELRADAMKIKAKTGKVGYGMPMGPEEAQAEFSLFALGNGGGWKKDGKWAINQPANQQALQWMVNLANNDKVTEPNPGSANVTDVWKVFGTGTIGMTLGSNFFPVLLKQYNPKLNYGVAPVPVNGSHPPVTLGVEDYLMVFKSTKNPELAKKFIDFFFQVDNYGQFIKREGFLPSTKSLSDKLSGTDQRQKAFIAVEDSAQFYPATDPTWAAISPKVKNDLGAAFHSKSVASVLSDLQKAAERGQ
jgi:multiple sugar transport system substrate-binding protein